MTLTERLLEYAEWAKCNEWETPIGLGRDLKEAAFVLETTAEKLPYVKSIGEILDVLP